MKRQSPQSIVEEIIQESGSTPLRDEETNISKSNDGVSWYVFI